MCQLAQYITTELTKHSNATITQMNLINMDIEYADDVFKVSSYYNNIRKLEDEAPKKLLSRGRHVNNTKTEEYVIKENTRKICKLLSSLLATTEDVKGRKTVITAYSNIEQVF